MFLRGVPLLHHGATKLLSGAPNCTANLSFNRAKLSGVSAELQRGFAELQSGIADLKSVYQGCDFAPRRFERAPRISKIDSRKSVLST